MTLTDPTDMELDLAFAAHVAHQVPCDNWLPYMHDSMYKVAPCDDHPDCYPRRLPTRYCDHAEAVLPWLDKSPRWNSAKSLGGEFHRVCIEGPCSVGEVQLSAEAKSFAKAAVIALLRWHCVEVRFSK